MVAPIKILEIIPNKRLRIINTRKPIPNAKKRVRIDINARNLFENLVLQIQTKKPIIPNTNKGKYFIL